MINMLPAGLFSWVVQVELVQYSYFAFTVAQNAGLWSSIETSNKL
jgi:hypothetical protein